MILKGNLAYILFWPLHRVYKFVISPLLGGRCRFEPPCSDYALQALRQYGFFRGALLAAGRLLRCNPMCAGGDDPVPEVFGLDISKRFYWKKQV